MKVLKFGGSSLASADKFVNVANIVQQESQSTQLSVVLSAPQGVTNLLVSLVENLDYCSDTGNLVSNLQTNLLRIKTELPQSLEIECPLLNETVNNEFERLNQLIAGAKLLGHCPDQTGAQILSFGERLSIIFLSFILTNRKLKVSLINPETFLVAENQSGETVANIPVSKQKFLEQYEKLEQISLMPGFVGSSPNNRTITLGRNGSDYSAAILAVCAQADVCEIWTDVDGVYNADPRLVTEAVLIEKMSFNEAIELSYFGAKILHPKTIVPLSSHDIPCLIKNSLSPQKEGTLISEESCNESNVKAISSLDEVAMIDVSGPGMKGKAGMTSRIFAAINRANLSVILISQSSAAYRVSFCVSAQQAAAAVECLEQEFELELGSLLLEPVIVTQGLSVVSLVGDKMQKQKGIAAKFFASLSQASVNIIAIAQDSSERSISAVIRGKRTDDAVKICHRNLFSKRSCIDAFVIGTGTVGNELLLQIEKQQSSLLATRNIDLKVYGIATSKQFLLEHQGINLQSDWKTDLSNSKNQFSLASLNLFVEENHLLNPVIIDATSNENIAMSYADYLAANYHVVAANKKANTASIKYYHQLRSAAQKSQRRFLYETNVAAGLPVIDNLQNLFGAGDQLIAFEGILSGSLSYIFGELHNGLSLSEATQKAKGLGFTEPNPAEDLSGLDVARKVLIIAREAGLNLELEDIQLDSILSDELLAIEDGNEFMQQLPSINDDIAAQVKNAEAEGKVLRHVAKISDGVCQVKVQAVDKAHPLFSVQSGENALAIHTHYYQPFPFVIRGYGAGAAVTAAGLFADMLRTLVWDLE
jgi:aspartokinase/homoserine dehydrogenase 1